ncbi:MAG: ATP-binding cassette domain-containing protein [Bacilli bacterium]|nr:ATP-binding cassette domain-containing protein [Bacilli bacterium]MBO6194871.1 ATP-binding cassette domain-containing protein [Bacilli bacterium]
MKHKYIGQQNSKDCGVICLYNIINYYKGSISLTKLRNMLNTNKEGTSVYDIVCTSNKLGLETEAYKCELNDICSLKLPIIAHIKLDGKYNHFVIIDKLIDDEIIIFDPIRGYINYEMEDFEKIWTNIIITFKKTKNLIKESDKNFNTYSKIIFNNISIITLTLFISIILSLFSIVHSLYLSYLFKIPSISYKIFILFLFICVSRLILDFIRSKIILNYTKDIDNNITSKVYNKILSLPLSYHHNRPIGDIVSRINDLSSIKEFINNISFSIIIDLVYILMISIILFIINKIMFLLLIIMMSIYILIYIIYRKNIKNKSLINKENASESSTFLIESLLGIDTIKNLNIEKQINNSFIKKYNKFLNSNYILNKFIVIFELLMDFISNISSIIIVFIGILFYKDNILSLSKVIAVNSLFIYFFISLKNIVSSDEMLIEAKNSYKRINELYQEKEEEKEENNIKFIDKISVNSLNYSYNGINNILENVSFNINKGEYIFVKGNSGTGKSSIFKLLTKQLECEENMIKINDIDINNINRKDITDNICLVSQNEYIFTDTILNNIKLFKDATKEEIEKVMRITGIDKMIQKRNIDINFVLEENGHNISGGERQRIILARSLLQNKKVLILDETLNELDIKSERNIIKNIKQEYDITLILISHRYNNSNLFNKIINI